MPITKLTVKYISSQHDIDKDLDKEIVTFFVSLGYYWAGSGIDLVEPFERDIEFNKVGVEKT